ncbi:MAG: fructose-6-phosphate aldolase [Candidatus Electryoneaceae bacterium]|nr:fructose-6-phosphate aldolase [Candidatus Electryoneaceae bacterium]
MKFFLDTANLDQIKDAASLGMLDGVTTNPSLLVKESRPYRELLYEICEVANGPVSAEVTATEFEGMIPEAIKLAGIHKHIVVKLPITRDGLKACVELRKSDIKVNMTLVFSAMQALLVAKAGANFVSPFVGRLDDISLIGMDLVRDIVEMYDNYDFPTEVLVASVRNPLHVLDAALMGAHVVTMPYKVIDQLLKHPLTDIGLEKFLSDWKKGGQKIL